MKKAGALLVLLLALLPAAYAEQDYGNAASMTADIEISGHADIITQNAKSRIDKAIVNLSLFPKDSPSQEVVDIAWAPTPVIGDGVATFTFTSPKESIDYIAKAKVRVGDSFVPVKEKIPFPLENLPEDVKIYTQPTGVIDSDDDAINRVTSVLVSGEDDLYGVVYTLARWTRENVEYNLSSLTQDVSQKASWVLLERQGVCDEIASLFIAMLRSVGVPARFVTGYAYTNSPLFPENWGAHGWAEVYFPGHGWVPFDITYGQFGWVDPSHIALKESRDPNDASTRYEWIGRDAELGIGGLKTTVDVLSTGGEAAPLVQLMARPMKDEIGFGSYNAIEATVKNRKDAYVMTELLLTVPAEVKLISKKAKDVLLKPGEEKRVFWIVRLGGDLEGNYIYTFPFTVSSGRGAEGAGSFSSTAQSPKYTLQDIGAIIDQRAEEGEKTYSSNVALNCTASPNVLYEYERGTIACRVRNTGNVPLDNLDVCLRKDCADVSLGITKSYEVEFDIDTDVIGRRDETVVAKNSKVSKAQDVPIEVRDIPMVNISGVEAPSSLRFDDEASLSFTVGKASFSIPENLTILVKLPSGDRGWTMDRLPKSQIFSMAFKGRDLGKGENAIPIEVSYRDGNGREYSSKEEVSITLKDVSFAQGVQLFFRNMGVWLASLLG
ncbi:transglutaminase domain-containing protein [Candidatus Woesearchaeota archaeon]|nr:transglutaminase domain-containing protein [Candidatus Woesearchaeota archaeon]